MQSLLKLAGFASATVLHLIVAGDPSATSTGVLQSLCYDAATVKVTLKAEAKNGAGSWLTLDAAS
jgi:hypothetical protein